ncbi:50S ribosomal protein L10 [candidate division CPR3 bacterium GWF2_35_18]|uniref:Large ribosomal subunit protein uL10 n=1 Tax=candidate division CPR3 bacterium GW2011_GWF2_35_18 TaxID=1618350 RepID=A0A0G0C061_UNCC3|nr:MAG: 50S ribosomal protein L10 [candidate division CPR3 bacterium GW2011_GWF2_35_18]KKP86531.1 MAG: 50S ribosomal protein L10 [candidate division CPR3 bacterium GW2011_GWE2_35_7]OGB62940.1 MAG: 50S ribosomal protein L10 [candidate division CPR3 bacterium GWF2_35_18]OGB65934.1 MAG: 50S ribosomal protein L10 [candidate division CPR3 bacterium RIFOXYA2_FULL_35_13]OGB78734.1 MAG: 50S ribosomal protein L10 [candidate division CPR3 bacterium RIFOXYB2_FULL_35_8]OGB80405.1 MAG: 50S ribosomal protei
MPNQANQKAVEQLNSKIGKSKAVYLTDYKGLSVNKIQELRKRLLNTESELQVTKNTLLKISLEKNGIKPTQEIEGPTATLFAYGDEITPLKIIIDFAKDNDSFPQLKFGVLAKDLLTIDQLKQLSALPNKQTLLTQFVGLLQSPLSNLVYGLNYHLISFVNVVNNIKNQKETKN